MQRIAQGEDIDLVLEEFTKRLTDKLMHPLYKEVKSAFIKKFDAEKSKREYEEQYLKIRQPIADHVEGNIFDNSREK